MNGENAGVHFCDMCAKILSQKYTLASFIKNSILLNSEERERERDEQIIES